MAWGVRKGFLVTVILLAPVVASTLWAIVALPYFPLHPSETFSVSQSPVAIIRQNIPSELAWFFIQYPYLSPRIQIRCKNRHTFLVSDPRRRREYVVLLGQHFRRVEIYFGGEKERTEVQVLTPGERRIVWFRGVRKVSDMTHAEDNGWLWRNPLWNAMHIKIYSLADFWRDAPYKRYSCAGFVHQFLNEAGVKVPVLDAWDIAKQPWTQVTIDELEPGDVITIRAGSESHRRLWHHRVTHVGVYLGNGKIIHAATSSPSARRAWVRIVDLDQFRQRIDKILRPPELL